ncbi:MAG TPA: hypothetical protein VHZ28_02905 [Terracidiphilus sp.]|nr:hypothetical protein [Terracidiphilus sp.]
MSNKIKFRAVVLALSALVVGAAQARAEEAFVEQPIPTAQTTKLDKTLHILTYPAYNFVPKYASIEEDHSKLGRTEQFVLAGERLGFLADATTTELGLSNGHESNPMNTMFGSNSRIGVVGSMTAWELGFGATSVIVPRWFEHTRYRKAARIAAIAGGAALTGFRVKMVMQNSQFIQ